MSEKYHGQEDYWEFMHKFPRENKSVSKHNVMIAFMEWLESAEEIDFDIDITKDWFRVITGKEKK